MLRHKGMRVTMLITLVGGLLVGAATKAGAETFPGFTLSHYVEDSSINASTWNSRGCSEATRQINGGDPSDAAVILPFGDPANQGGTYGVIGFAGPFLSLATIQTAIDAYGDGYYSCSNSSIHLTLVIGTTNHGSRVTSTHGTKWAGMIDSIDTHLGSETTRVVVIGGSDIELDWSSQSVAQAWVTAYKNATSHHFFDFGDAAGCPQTTHTNGGCDNGWNQSGVLGVSWLAQGSSHTVFPLPQQYNTLGHNADQWEQIDFYSVTLPRGAINVRGSLTQNTACSQRGGCSGTDNTVQAGWTFLNNALDSNASTQQLLNWATDLRWGWGSQH